MYKNTQQPVARINTVGGYPDDSRHELELLVKHYHLSDGQLLYTSQPVPRDVLMAAMREVQEQSAVFAKQYVVSEPFIRHCINLGEIADRYASQARRSVRTHTESQLAAVERVRESHQKFVEETGIDYAALAASGFDANSGVPVQPEPSLTDRQIKHMLALETALSKLIDKVAPGLLLDGDILAEAEEALRIADAQPEPVNQQTLAALKRLLECYKMADHRDGYCCCGSPMATHDDPMNCGHCATDAGEYNAGLVIKDMEAAIAAAEAAQPVAIDRATIRQIFMAHGFTIKDGQTDLKPYVYEAAEALLRAQQPGGAQPAAVLDERAAFEAWAAKEYPGLEIRQQNLLGTYTKTMTEWLYTGWEARAMLSAAQKPEGV